MAEERPEGGIGGEEEEIDVKLEFTPTWIVASVCAFIIFISLFFERSLHHLGKVLKKKNQKPLFNALQKVKEELMLLGFISLLLTAFQGVILKICIPRRWTHYMLPCEREKGHHRHHHHLPNPPVDFSEDILDGGRRLLEEGVAHCGKARVPLLSIEAIHQLHIFIFVLAVTHVVFSAITVLLGGAKVHQWKQWEDSIQKEFSSDVPKSAKYIHQFHFIMDRVKSIHKDSIDTTWLHSFFKQFYWSVTKSDYITLRLIFITTHCKANPKFDFHEYIMRAFESDFKQVVGTSWYLWLYVIIFLLMNVNGWHTYFLIAVIPLILLLAVGTKLEHVITELAHNVAEKYFATGEDFVVEPSDEYFWFHRPRILLYMVHFILFQNAFEIAFLFWLFIPYGFDSCVIDHMRYAIPRVVIGVIIQLLCSYSTLPLYAVVTQMGTHFKKTIFDDHVQVGIAGWAQKAKKRSSLNMGCELTGSSHGSHGQSESVRMTETSRLVLRTEPLAEGKMP